MALTIFAIVGALGTLHPAIHSSSDIRCNKLETIRTKNANRHDRVEVYSTRHRMRRRCSAVLLAASARAEEVKAGDLVITQAWSRATPGGAKVAGGYLTIENKGSAPDRLIGGSGDVAGKVEVHEMAMNNGVMTMRPLDNGLTIEPGKTVKLAPGGYHLMMFDLEEPAQAGRQVAGHAGVRKGRQGDALARRAGRRRAGARGRGRCGGHMDMKKMPDHSGMKM